MPAFKITAACAGTISMIVNKAVEDQAEEDYAEDFVATLKRANIEHFFEHFELDGCVPSSETLPERSQAQKNLAKLPARCAAVLLESGEPIMLEAGIMGYHNGAPLGIASLSDVMAFNARHGIPDNQVAAMMAGSAFGWEVPAADPDTIDPAKNLYTSYVTKGEAAV